MRNKGVILFFLRYHNLPWLKKHCSYFFNAGFLFSVVRDLYFSFGKKFFHNAQIFNVFKVAFIITFFLLTSGLVKAQKVENKFQNPDFINQQISGNDSLSNENLMKADSLLHLKTLQDSLGYPHLNTEAYSDSLQNFTSGFRQISDSLSGYTNISGFLNDSLQSLNTLSQIDRRRELFLDSLSMFDLPDGMKNTVDSLRSLPSLTDQLTSKLDLSKIKSNDTLISKYSDALNSLLKENDLTGKENSLLPDNFYDQLQDWKASGLEGSDLGKINELESWIGDQESKFGSFLSAEGLEEKLSLDLDYLSQLKDKTGNISGYLGSFNNKAGQYTDKLGGVSNNLPGQDLEDKIPGIDNIEGLENLPSEDVEKLISEYNQLSPDQVDERIDQMAKKVEEVNVLEQNTSKLGGEQTKYLSEVEKLNQYNNEKFLKQQALKKSRLLANDVIEENYEQIANTFEEIRNYKNKYAKVNSNVDVEAGIEKPVKNIDLQKRFFFGVNLQLVTGDPVSIDFAPLAGYRLSMKFTVGVGGLFRYDIKSGEKYFPGIKKEPVYGYNGFLQYTIVKSIFLHGQAERLSIYDGSETKVWQTNFLAGIGKRISLRKNLSMDILLLYHFNHKNNPSYNTPFMIKTGINTW